MKVAGLYPQPVNRGPHGEIEFLEPLGLEYVLAQVADQHDVKLFTLFDGTVKQTVEKIIQYSPDVLAVSAMTPQINLGLKMAGKIKRKLPNVQTIFGGYHPTAMPSITHKPEVDLVIMGEGEEKFTLAINNPAEFRKRMGVSYKNGGITYIREGRERILNLDSLRDPIRPDFLEQLRDHGHRYPVALKQTGMASVLFSKGCLFNCEFCSSPGMYKQKVTYRSTERVVAELQNLSRGRGINAFFFADLNFTANQGKTRELCDAIIGSGMKIYWECLSNISTVKDPALLQLMYDAGCRKIGWGIESLDPSVIDVMGKRGLERTHEVLQASEDAGIINTGFYMIGHPSETEASILASSKGISSLPLHRLRVTVNTPLPGSRLYQNTSPTNSDFDLYDTTHLVFNHPSLFQNDLDRLRKKLTSDFYNSGEYKARVKSVVARFPEYKEVFGK